MCPSQKRQPSWVIVWVKSKPNQRFLDGDKKKPVIDFIERQAPRFITRVLVIAICAVYMLGLFQQSSQFWGLPESVYKLVFWFLPLVLVVLNVTIEVLLGRCIYTIQTAPVTRWFKTLLWHSVPVIVSMIYLFREFKQNPQTHPGHLLGLTLLLILPAASVLVVTKIIDRTSKDSMAQLTRKNKSKEAIEAFKPGHHLNIRLVFIIAFPIVLIVMAWIAHFNLYQEWMTRSDFRNMYFAVTLLFILIDLVFQVVQKRGDKFFKLLFVWAIFSKWWLATVIYFLTMAGVALLDPKPLNQIAAGLFVFGLFMLPPTLGILIIVKLGRDLEQNILKRNGTNENDLRWMVTNNTFSKRERIEIGRHLSTLGPKSITLALTLDLKDDVRTDLAASNLFSKMFPDNIRYTLSKMDQMSEDTVEKIMLRWQTYDQRFDFIKILGQQNMVANHKKWSILLTNEAHTARQDGAQWAAITALTTQSIGAHATALSYLGTFGNVDHIQPLQAAKEGFSIHVGLDDRIEALIEDIKKRAGVEQGGLSLAEDTSSRGGLSTIQPADGALSVSDEDKSN